MMVTVEGLIRNLSGTVASFDHTPTIPFDTLVTGMVKVEGLIPNPSGTGDSLL